MGWRAIVKSSFQALPQIHKIDLSLDFDLAVLTHEDALTCALHCWIFCSFRKGNLLPGISFFSGSHSFLSGLSCIYIQPFSINLSHLLRHQKYSICLVLPITSLDSQMFPNRLRTSHATGEAVSSGICSECFTDHSWLYCLARWHLRRSQEKSD